MLSTAHHPPHVVLFSYLAMLMHRESYCLTWWQNSSIYTFLTRWFVVNVYMVRICPGIVGILMRNIILWGLFNCRPKRLRLIVCSIRGHICVGFKERCWVDEGWVCTWACKAIIESVHPYFHSHRFPSLFPPHHFQYSYMPTISSTLSLISHFSSL